MANNTMRPGLAGPPRANTVRRRPELEVVPTNAPAAPVEAEAPVAVAAPAPAAPVAPAAPAPAAPREVPGPGDGPRRQPRPAPRPLTDEEADAQAAAWTQTRTDGGGWSLFSLLDRFTSLDGLFREGLPVRYLPKLLFVMGLTLLYIGNTHYGNRMNRSIQRLKQETEDLRADYTTLKSDYMEASKQSEVARKVAAIGLIEPSAPPFRITVPAGRLAEAELEDMPVLTTDSLAARAARDSVAQARADAAEGRVRRQQLGLPATPEDEAPEAGAPPPGPSEDDAQANDADSRQPANVQSASASAGPAKPAKQLNSIKKHKTAQSVSAKPKVAAKPRKSAPTTHGTGKKNEKQR